jgi:hypothetical protein
MNRINQFAAKSSCQFILGLGIAAFLAQAQIFSSSKVIAQTVVDTIPTPQLNKSIASPGLEEVFVPRDLDFRAPQLSVSQKVDSYLVYIDDINPTQLEQIKKVIPTAFRRQHQGKAVIQAGVFSQQSNAISLVYKLQSQGIYPHLVNLTTAKEVAAKIGQSSF